MILEHRFEQDLSGGYKGAIAQFLLNSSMTRIVTIKELERKYRVD